MIARTGDLLLGRYRLLEPHGETALWRGFLARDERQEGAAEREAGVLVKLVRSELAHDEPSRAYVLRELTRVRLLQHPAIVRPAELLTPEDRSGVILVEPIQPGLSQGLLLSRMVIFRRDEGDRFKLDEVRRIGVQLASALGYVHGQLLCHGDLRLESVLLRPEGVRLCDVGLGRALPRGPYLDAVQKAGEVHLLAPEARTGRPPDVRADVFGLAALYRHLLSMGDEAAWDLFQGEQPALTAILLRALEGEPQARYPSVEAFVADVEAVALTGAPIRRRHSPTPLALAVAAGRLPVEELSRPPEAPAASSEDHDVVLAPLSTSTSARISMSPRAPRSSSGISAPPRLVGLTDEDAQQTRQVRKGDASDLGSNFTIPVDRLEAAELALAWPAPPPEGADVLDHTVEQSKLDPDELLTSAVVRLDLPDDGGADGADGLPTVKVTPEDLAMARASAGLPAGAGAAPASALALKELPPLLPPSAAPAPEDAATGLYAPPAPVRRSKSGDSSSPRTASGRTPLPQRDSLTPTKAMRSPPEAPVATLSLRTIVGALLLAVAVGALGATLALSLLSPSAPAPVPTAVPVAGETPPLPLRPQAPEAAAPPRMAAQSAQTALSPKPILATGGCPPGMTALAAPTPFCIDQHEQPGAGQKPSVGVGYKDAEAACQKLGHRLCTDSEWELACRGKGRSSYPYGHDVRLATCNTQGQVLLAAGARPGCVSAAGAFDMAGNAAEWVQGGSLRGASAQGETDGRCSVRLKVPPGGKGPFTGYRCCH